MQNKRWGELDVFDAFEEALEGRLDIAPRAVRDDLNRKQERGRTRTALKVQFREHGPAPGHLDSTDAVESELEAVEDRTAVTDHRLLRHEIREFARTQPRFFQYLTARLH